MLIPVLSRYLAVHKRLVVPQLGAFIVKQTGESILFSELLKRDDGVLRQLLCEAGLSELEAAGEIDRFVFEVRHAVEHGAEYPLPGFGVMKPGPNRTIAFAYDPQPVVAEPEVVPDAAAAGAADVAGEGTADAAAGAAGRPEGVAAAAGAAAGTGTAASTAGNDASAAKSSGATDSGPADAGDSAAASVRTRMPSGKGSGAARTESAEPRVSPSVKLNPDPSVRGLRYGRPPKTTDAYTYVDRPPRRRADRFIWIALIAAAIALAAIAFGYWRDVQQRRAEDEYLLQPQTPPAQTSAEDVPAAQTTLNP